MNAYQHLRQAAQRLNREIHALYLAFGDPRVPWYAKLLPICVVAYVLSPIDLTPDFIPILGYMDDLLLLPLSIWLVLCLIPKRVMAECRLRAAASDWQEGVIVVIGLGLLGGVGWFLLTHWR